MGEGTTPGCLATSALAAGVGAAAPDVEAPDCTCAGIEAAMLMLRATRNRRPARSISISVRLVSSSRRASSRISALSSLVNFAAFVSSGWRAMILIRSFLWEDGRKPQARRLGAEFGGKAIARQPVAVDAEAANGCECGPGGEGMMTEIL